ncbi:MerR family DNA-binding transcriptional regulator [Microcoleus sp. bin38.metabat.b11b12b14.051]|uniref:MerR family DNA-binding transcriptional regulator n=1 Tax=Microcoleus sp. bin38.metabat.b11b12b14.051 TaxID=2742709 RepID=UPI0025DC097B|nr:MerR family DNA-binding transcriptional regulator [Microcoleus sp. bin38.metabat.b11b12b14.051]
MDRLISIGELAQLKAVSVDTIRRWEKNGKIESVRTCKMYRYDYIERSNQCHP